MSLSKFEAISRLMQSEGMDRDEFLDVYALESVVPAICLNCGAFHDMEPDQDEGACECGANQVKSGLVLMGVI
jgi:hypothetical protein